MQNYNSPCIAYGCNAWSPALRKEYKLRVFENKLFRIISGPKRKEGIEE
jgi:hypothetical protein